MVDDGSDVMQWRESLSLKYSDLPGVRRYHDFLIARGADGSVAMKVREKCYAGSFSVSPLKVLDPNANGSPRDNYRDTHHHPLKEEKLEDMKLMYNRFISPERRPRFLPPYQNAALPASLSATPATASSTATLPARPRKRSQCQTPGCDGTGHKNPSRWNEGHTTRAGCPKAA